MRARLGLLACLAATVVACGGSPAPSSTSPGVRPSPSGSQSGGPTPTAVASPGTASTTAASDLIPEHDTPFDQATPAQKAAWANKNVTLIPGRSTIAAFRKAPAVENAARGVVTDDDARNLVAADYRFNAFQQWAARHGQQGLLAYVTPTRQANDQVFQAFAAGATAVDIPDCGAFATTIVVVPIAPALAEALSMTQAPLDASFKVAILETFDNGGGCTYVAHFGSEQRVIASLTGLDISVSVVKVRADQVLGDLLDSAGGGSCATLPSGACAT